MYIPKRYGQSSVDKCPFCSEQATVISRQGIAVCTKHKNSNLKDMKCVCGSYVELRTGKFGAYFSCHKCGNVNFKRVMEVNEHRKERENEKGNWKDKEGEEKKTEEKPRPKEIFVRSDDPRYF